MLPDGRAPWRYKHDVEEWRAYLADPPPFMEIVDLLCAGLVAEGWWIQRADRSPLLVAHGCKRVALKLVPSDASDPAARKVLDLFFNSTAGYRAQFYISADQGDRATAELFAALLLGPLAEGARGGIGEFSGADVARSLRSLAAKVWINDEAVPLEGRRDIPGAEVDRSAGW